MQKIILTWVLCWVPIIIYGLYEIENLKSCNIRWFIATVWVLIGFVLGLIWVWR